MLDFGNRDAFKRGHWPGAVNIPLDELAIRGGPELPRGNLIQRRLDLLDSGLSNCRLGVFALALATAFIVWRADLTPWALLVPGIAFLVLVVWHERVIEARRRTARALAHYERGPNRAHASRMNTILHGVDLDLFGPGSMFELLSTARTRDGEAELAGWRSACAWPWARREGTSCTC